MPRTLPILYSAVFLMTSGCSLKTGGDFVPTDDAGADVDEEGIDFSVDHEHDIPADVPIDVPADVPVDIPADTPADIPIDIPVDREEDEEFECLNNSDCDDGNLCNGIETCAPDSHTCVEGTAWEDGAVCNESPRRICLDGACVDTTCGDCFTDRGAGESCDDCNDDPSDGCHNCEMTCTGPDDCDDSDFCNGVETCNLSTGQCQNGVPFSDGTVCVEIPRSICLSGICSESMCGDGFVDTGGGEVCEGSDEIPCTTSCGTTGYMYCWTCSWSDCMPPAEICNGADDDCDGSCDEDFGCCAGTSGSCTTSCGSTGQRTCTPGCTWGSCSVPSETCNGVDDDCDGFCDEDFECCSGDSDPFTFAHCTFYNRCSGACRWEPDYGTPPPNNTCASAATLTCPGVQTGSTCSATNDLAPSTCGSACNLSHHYARELVYRIVVPTGERWRITLDTYGSELDTILYVRQGNCNASNEIDCNDDSGGLNSYLSLNLDEGTYYVIVDSCYTSPFANDLGSFTLTCSFR